MTNHLDAAHRSPVGADTFTAVADRRDLMQASSLLFGLATQSTRLRRIQLWIGVRVAGAALVGQMAFRFGFARPY